MWTVEKTEPSLFPINTANAKLQTVVETTSMIGTVRFAWDVRGLGCTSPVEDNSNL